MKCQNCGEYNTKDANFCENCGNLLIHMEKKKTGKFNKKWIVVLGIILVVVIIITVVIALGGKNVNTYEKQMTSADCVAEENDDKDEDIEKELDEKESIPAVTETPIEEETDTDTNIEPEEQDEKEESQPEELLNTSLDDEIQKIREIYYGVTMHNENFNIYSSTDKVTVYEAKSDGHIQCICADIGAYREQFFESTETYAAEYYYSYIGEMYQLRFVFVHNADYSEEYRIYFNEDQKCIRYIGPYESDKTTYDYVTPKTIAELEGIVPVSAFCSYGQMELHWMGIY